MERLPELQAHLTARFEAVLNQLPFHNWQHVLRVTQAAKTLGTLSELSSHEVDLLVIAGLYHDCGFYNRQRAGHERRSAEIARADLETQGYSHEDIATVEKLILATEVENVNGNIVTNPQNLLEKIICDADLAALGSEDFPQTSEALRQELGIADQLAWLKIQEHFLASHQYHTPAAHQLWDEQKQKNLDYLRQQIAELS